MNPLVLRAPQVPMIDWLYKRKRAALWAGMGIGKSSASLFLIDLLRLMSATEGPTLVIGPSRVARDTWPEEVAKWEQFKTLRIVPITGTPKQRLDKLKIKADIYTISYELLPWLVAVFMERWPFRQVVADECDRLKGFRLRQGADRAHQIGRVAHTLVTRWINLTGTPSPNGLADLWGQTWFLDRGERLGRTYQAFTDRWFRPNWSGYGYTPLKHAEKEIHALLSDICLTIDPKDYFDLREPYVVPVKVKLPAAARKIYDQLESEMFADLGETSVEAFNAASLTSKCLQLANGALYTDSVGSWSPVHNAKLEALESIQKESGGTPLLVAYQFKSDKARILNAFKGAVDISKPDGMVKFKRGGAAIGLAHPRSLGHGIDGLQNVTNILVRFGHDWSLGERMQMLERIGPMRQLQSGHDRLVYVYDIIAERTIDEDVIRAHTAKRSVQDALLEAMKRRAQ